MHNKTVDIDYDSNVTIGDITTALHHTLAKAITLSDALQHGNDTAAAYNARLLTHCVRDAIALIQAIGNDVTADSQHPRKQVITPL